MTTSKHPMIGKRRITGMELRDNEFIDLLGPGYTQFHPDGGGEFVFGALQGRLDCHQGQTSIHFTRAGHDQTDETPGDGDAQLEENATLTGDIRFHLGDGSSFTARRRSPGRSLVERRIWSRPNDSRKNWHKAAKRRCRLAIKKRHQRSPLRVL